MLLEARRRAVVSAGPRGGSERQLRTPASPLLVHRRPGAIEHRDRLIASSSRRNPDFVTVTAGLVMVQSCLLSPVRILRNMSKFRPNYAMQTRVAARESGACGGSRASLTSRLQL